MTTVRSFLCEQLEHKEQKPWSEIGAVSLTRCVLTRQAHVESSPKTVARVLISDQMEKALSVTPQPNPCGPDHARYHELAIRRRFSPQHSRCLSVGSLANRDVAHAPRTAIRRETKSLQVDRAWLDATARRENRAPFD